MTVTYKNPTGAQMASLPFMLYPNAYAQFANEVTLPLYSTLTDEQVEYVIAAVLQSLEEDV